MKAENLRSDDLDIGPRRIHATWTARVRGDVPRELPVAIDRPVDVFALEPRSRSERANRILNFCLAIAAFILLAPVLVVVALIVKLSSPGPILYTQTRVGLDRRRPRRRGDARLVVDRRNRDLGGRVFRIYKFRSMHADAVCCASAGWTSSLS